MFVFPSPVLPVNIDAIKGFLHPDEGAALYHYAKLAASTGPCLEVGSYCGKSTVYLGQACAEQGAVLFAVDHHRGSEEHQLGEAYHDASLYSAEQACVDTFPVFRRTIKNAQLENTVVPIVATSVLAAKALRTPLSLVFIDGGHSFETAQTDLHSWQPHLQVGGYLLIHDLFPNPDEGGQAPISIYREALASGNYEALPTVHTLGVLRRIR